MLDWAKGGVLIGALVLGGWGRATGAVEVGPSPTPENPVAPGDVDVLRGPGAELSGELSIVRRDSSGRIVELEEMPEEAAYRLVEPGLDGAARERAEGLMTERAMVWDAVYYDHIELILEVQGLAAAEGWTGEKTREALRKLAGFAPTVEEERAWGERFAGALGEEAGARVRRMAGAYREARRAQAMEDAAKSGRGGAAAGALERIKWIGAEIRRAADRRREFEQARLDEALGALGLTPEQDARARAAIVAFAQKKRLKTATPADGLELYRSLSEALTREQLRQLMGSIGRGK